TISYGDWSSDVCSSDLYYEGDDFVFAGKVGTGFDTKLLTELRTKLDALEIEKPPFTKAKGLPRLRAHWVKPRIVVQVSFIEWTEIGRASCREEVERLRW